MRKALSCLIVVSAISIPGAVLAQDMPDLKGTWSVESQSLRIDKPGTDNPWVGGITADYVVEWQEGNRFYGREADQTSTEGGDLVNTNERIMGIIAPDGKLVFITDENGFRDCWLNDPNTMHCLYRHIQDDQNVLAWNVWTRNPQ